MAVAVLPAIPYLAEALTALTAWAVANSKPVKEATRKAAEIIVEKIGEGVEKAKDLILNQVNEEGKKEAKEGAKAVKDVGDNFDETKTSETKPCDQGPPPEEDPKDNKKSPQVPKDPSQSPGEGWEWRGKEPVGGDKGAWVDPKTGESLHPDLNHPEPIGPHWDYKDPSGKMWRLYPNGNLIPK